MLVFDNVEATENVDSKNNKKVFDPKAILAKADKYCKKNNIKLWILHDCSNVTMKQKEFHCSRCVTFNLLKITSVLDKLENLEENSQKALIEFDKDNNITERFYSDFFKKDKNALFKNSNDYTPISENKQISSGSLGSELYKSTRKSNGFI